MELTTRLDARDSTKEMLLDNFVDGFLFKLFLTKWEKVCVREHVAQLAMQVSLITSCHDCNVV